jgi:DNA repair protein RadD
MMTPAAFNLSPISLFFDEYVAPLTLVQPLSKIPRYYQSNAVNQVADYLEEGWTRIGVKSPTGTGKTLITKLVALSDRIRASLNIPADRKIRVLYVAAKRRLLRQAMAEYAGSDSIEFIPQSAMAGIPDAVMNKGWDIAFLDECHHEAMMSIQKILNGITKTPLIGFTADDTRGDKLLLKFERFVVAISEYEAASRGFTEKVGVNTVIDLGGSDKTAIVCNLLDNYHQHMGNTIVFMRTAAECKRVYRHIKRLGLKASILVDDSNEKDMDAALDLLSAGRIQFLINSQRVAEGIDAANVTDVLLGRHFNSAAEKKQYIGRAIRPDSPCAVWELVNPLVDGVSAKSVVGDTKYERLLTLTNNQWSERMLSGADETWGMMSELRFDTVPAFTDSTDEPQGIFDTEPAQASLFDELNDQELIAA